MKINPKKLALAAVIAAVVYWLFFRTKKREVLDPSNSPELDKLFNEENPELPA